jgi:hypothetical protein
MTKKDFVLIANTIRNLVLVAPTDPTFKQLDLQLRIAQKFADVLQKTYPNFNRTFFIDVAMGDPDTLRPYVAG